MSEDLPAGYPHLAEADVVLRDGSVARLRPILPSDAEGIHRFHSGQSEESIYLRFFAPIRRLSDKDVARFTQVDYVDRMALVALVRDDIIGIGRYDRVDESSAEVAFNISDSYQGKGIGSVLLEHLAALAQERGITRFEAEVLPQNRKMLGVFSEAGYEVSRRYEDGVVMLHFDIAPTAQSLSVRFAREHRAEAASVRALLHPRSVAVIGASRRERAIGHQVLAHVLDTGFTGAVYPVNPEADEVLGLPAVATVSDLPGEVDLAVVAVPAESVPAVVRECAAKGVHGALVISSGFAEVDERGAALQDSVLRVARDNGMRLIGPNSFGVLNLDPALRLNATLSPQVPPAGFLGLYSQSGALAVANLYSAARRNLGVSVFASAGNRADVSGNDVMQYWIDDDRTHAVGLYLESMGNPRKFSRIARALAANKPVIVVKSVISSGAPVPGHRVRSARVQPHAFTSMLKQAGVIHVENVHQMFDAAQLLLHQPLPAGRRVAVVTNSHQLGSIITANALAWDLDVVHGPVAVGTEASVADFTTALQAAFDAEDVDSVVVAFIPPVGALDQDVVEAVRESARRSEKPCVATLLGLRGVDTGSLVHEDGPASDGAAEGTQDDVAQQAPERPGQAVPLYGMPEEAVRALALATRYGMWRAKDKGDPLVREGTRIADAREVIDAVLADDPDGRALTDDEAHRLLTAYGIDLWQRVEVETADEAVHAAEELGYPVVVKSLSPLVRGQSLLDGIRVDLRDADAVRAAFTAMDQHLAPLDANYFVLQKMARSGIACVLGTVEDPLFGPVVSVGLAGAPTDLLDDIAYRIPPMTDVDCREILDDLKLAPLLDGYRGAPPTDRRALEDIIGRLSLMCDDLLELSSLELNPVMAHQDGATVLGAEILIRPAQRRSDPGRRALG
ncbi:bifunctional GNAT family N-acetyltransferase/acetate--CoA ligase family protein [Marihabitans asiaticum]|uniref:Acyl-CoA synthetase (NDP forming) n=1 Tax=Marihabitans asiaticum TaxID=415218 RepID=A0A560W6W0_9MICO|nr:bifunctional GNAT family N-acetyltransferase/acetate--CoA ligase family protein [Marihabitans asiaticum]TWD13356.1 acyl-CoA synthetase (NDP forming) [Marihabitans asiaticum]